MDFERAYQNFLDGTATEEEIEFVRAEMNKARAINDVIDNVKPDEKIVKAEQEEVKKAVRKFKIKDTIKVFVIVCVSLVIVTGIVLASIFIPAYNHAKDNINISEKEAKQMAIEYVADKDNVAIENVKIREIEREFEYNGRIRKAHFVYVIEVYNGVDKEYEIEVNAKTGKLIVEQD